MRTAVRFVVDLVHALGLLAQCWLLHRHGWGCRYGVDHERRPT